MKQFVLATVFLLFIISAKAQTNLPTSLGDFKSMKKSANSITITTNNGTCRVMVYSPSVLRVTINKTGQFRDLSYAVIASPIANAYTISETKDEVVLSTDSVNLTISKKPLRLFLLNKAARLINADETAFGTSWVGEQVTTYKKLQPGERFIGLGEKTGNLDRFGEGYSNWNTDAYGYDGHSDPLYSTIPFYIGLHDNLCYGIFMDNSYRSTFSFGASNNRFASFGADGGDMDYYMIYRSTVAGVIESYTALTGRMELPPKWALGFQQCRYSYYPQAEVLTLAQTFRDKKIPCDVIYLDIHYMDKYKLFTWDTQRFPDPRAMLKQLGDQNFKVVTIIDPGIKAEKGYDANEEGMANNYFLKYPDGSDYTGQVWPGWCHFPDFTKPVTREWWGGLFKYLIDQGVDGFWNDMNEPATWGQKFPDNVIFDFEGKKSTHREGHNVYGFQMARSTFEGQKKLLAGRRPFTLTRAGYAGLQRYTAIWTGDNQATDDHLLLGVRLVNSLGLSGEPFCGYDVSGFAQEATKELYTRWMTVGAFCPFYRSHKEIGSKNSEPWSYGERAEETSRNFIQLRYNLMPYIYSSFYESTQNGIPVQRSLAINYSKDENIYKRDYQNQYLFGPSLMVIPCISTDNAVKAYLPEGKWFDLYTDKIYEGNNEVLVSSPLEKLPVMVKAGSIIPMQSPVQSTADAPTDTLVMQVYGGANGSFVYYDDAGDGYDYLNKNYSKRIIALDNTKRELTLSDREGTYMTPFRYIKFIFHGVEGINNSIKVDDVSEPLVNDKYDYLDANSKQGTSVKSIVAKLTPYKMTLKW